MAEAAVQSEAAEHTRGSGEEGMPASEEGIPSEDGTASRDSSCSSRLLCMAGRAG